MGRIVRVVGPSLRLAAVLAAAAVVLETSACGGGSTGDAIVFSAATAGSTAQLFSIDASGAGLTQLTTGAHPAMEPALSPDGKELAFSRIGVGVFTLRNDGTGLHRVTTGARDSYPTWSPDGRRIAFVRPVGARWQLDVVPKGGGRPKWLSQSPPAGRPSWTKAGLLVPSGGDLLRVDPATGHVLKYYGANIDAIWGLNTVSLSPSATTLTFVGARAPEPGDKECGEGPCQRFGLYLESLTTRAKHPRLILRDSGPATFSPDGKQLALVTGDNKLELLPVGGGAPKLIATGSVYPSDTAPPAWGRAPVR